MLIIDGFATFFRVLVIGIGILAILSSTEYLRRENIAGRRILRADSVQHRGPVRHGRRQ